MTDLLGQIRDMYKVLDINTQEGYKAGGVDDGHPRIELERLKVNFWTLHAEADIYR